MTQLLVSVRNAHEAAAALTGGADVIDVKDPARGSLGAAQPHHWRSVAAAVAGKAPLSAALGEAREFDFSADLSALAEFSFAKIGLAGCAKDDCWTRFWRDLRPILPDKVQLVAVAYADDGAAHSPPPLDVLHRAKAEGLGTMLLDTFDKTQGDLWQALGATALQELAAESARLGIRLALAGSLYQSSLAAALALRPAWIAVRGAACAGGSRVGEVDRARVAELRAVLTACGARVA